MVLRPLPSLSAVLLAFLLGTACAPAASAHAQLLGTSPAPGSRLHAAPQALRFKFNEAVRLALLSLASSGTEIKVALDREAPAAAELSVPLPALGEGTYEVRWSALSSGDGHVVRGSFSFQVAGGP